MDSGLEERILPSIRRSQMLLIYRNGGVVGQVAHFNLTPEASLCRGFYLLPFVLSKGWWAQAARSGQTQGCLDKYDCLHIIKGDCLHVLIRIKA